MLSPGKESDAPRTAVIMLDKRNDLRQLTKEKEV
jgi:hypothetical protein